MEPVPEIRIRLANDLPINAEGKLVLYWMTAFRRRNWNFSLQRAVQWAAELGKPLVVLEALRCDYPWASDRLHRFIIEGMADNLRDLASPGVCYYPFVEQRKGEGKGLIRALGEHACVVVADDYPAFFLPRMLQAAAGELRVKFELVDGNGLLPLAAARQAFTTAFSFRRFLQKNLPLQLDQCPAPNPLEGASLPALATLPEAVVRRWPPTAGGILEGRPEAVAGLPVAHHVSAAPLRGGSGAARERLRSFLKGKFGSYHLIRNHPDEDAGSGLSPYLHFGHLGVHQVVSELFDLEEWTPDRLGVKATGRRVGWWGLSDAAEAFLDQLITWRELGFNRCSQRDDYDRLESLPSWALRELEQHAGDRRPYCYGLAEFEAAATHDALWNAAQCQLLEEGRLHNYLRMLWGKKILEWSSSPRDALAIMIELNNKYALDGRDPNSYTGILWVLGCYDRPWFPVRPVFGRIRYMSTQSTLRKLRVEAYLARYSRRLR